MSRAEGAGCDEEEEEEFTHIPSQTNDTSLCVLLFSKSKVYIHPTPRSKDNISGYVALVRTPSQTVLLSWIPDSFLSSSLLASFSRVDLASSEGKPVEIPSLPLNSSYAFSIPLPKIYSLLVRPPSLGWWWGSIVINAKDSTTSYPALFFHDSECESTILQSKSRSRDFNPFGEGGDMFWGGDEVLRWITKYTIVQRSSLEKMVYLVDPTPDDVLGFNPILDEPGPKMDTVTKTIKEGGWNLLEQFGKITRFSRKTAQDLFESPNFPPQLKKLMKNPDVRKVGEEYDSARLYLARWAMGLAEDSERRRRLEHIHDEWEEESGLGGAFEVLSIATNDRKALLSPELWESWFHNKRRLMMSSSEIKEHIFHGGVDPSIRADVWKYLLGLYPWDSDGSSRAAILASKRDEYFRLKRQWWDDDERRDSEFWRDQKSRIEKDVHRTDRNILLFAGEDTPHPDPDSAFSSIGTNMHMEMMKDMLLTYNEYNRELGYVQGMSDLLAPVYAVMQDDAAAFWCFCGFMERMEPNFKRDQSGMRKQLVTLDGLVQLMLPKLYKHLEKADSTNFFFFFRMLLVWYKREFEWDDVQILWEALWTDYLTSHFHLFVALAILDKHKDVIMGIFTSSSLANLQNICVILMKC